MSDEPGFEDITDNERNMHGSDDSVWLPKVCDAGYSSYLDK
jgi:hypothetical protein